MPGLNGGYARSWAAVVPEPGRARHTNRNVRARHPVGCRSCSGPPAPSECAAAMLCWGTFLLEFEDTGERNRGGRRWRERYDLSEKDSLSVRRKRAAGSAVDPTESVRYILGMVLLSQDLW